MKKTMMAVIGIICLGVGFTNAENVAVSFDGSENKSINPYVIAKVNENNETQKVPTPQAVRRSSAEDTANPYKDRIIAVKDLLKDLSTKDRVEFMSSIKLTNGRVAARDYTVLERNGLSLARIDEILLAFESQEEDINSDNPAIDRPMVQMGELLQGIPEKTKEDLLDNMKLLNGAMVSVKTDALEKEIAPERFEEILSIIMPAAPGAESRHILTDYSCNASTGAKGKAVLRGCDFEDGYKCNTTTCK